jgi:hypothetical protein
MDGGIGPLFGEVEMAEITYDLSAVFQATPDLEAAKRALVRETVIRETMTKTGEDRKTVTDMIDAMGSMGQEAVLDLTEGQPTTLADALQRYVDQLPGAVTTMTGEVSDQIAGDLSTLLAYPWPGVLDAEALTREIHEAYVRLAPRFGVEVMLWTS